MSETTFSRGGVRTPTPSYIATDNQTMSGGGTEEDPVLATGLPPLASAFSLITQTIYVRPSGSDEDGNGSLKSPYGTVQHAVQKVASIAQAGRSYVFDLTGVTETLPPNFQFSTILTSMVGSFTAQPSPAPWYNYGSGVVFTATPQIAAPLTTAQATISAADAANVTTTSAISGLCAIVLGTARPSWAANAMKGKHLVRSVKSATSANATCAIYGSDSTHLYLCNDSGTLNGGDGALVLASGEVIQIVEPSCTLIGSAPTGDNSHGISCWNINAPIFQGIHFVAPAGLYALAMGNADIPALEMCDVEGLLCINTPNGFTPLGCTMSISYDLEPVPGLPTRTLFTNFNQSQSYFYIADQLQTFNDVVFDDTCPTLTEGVFFTPVPSNWGLSNVLFQGSTGDAISAHTGQWNLVNVEIDGAAGNAITCQGDATMFLTNVGGTGSTGYGVEASNGTKVLVDGTTAVAGTMGDAKSGGLAVKTWTAVADGQAYDLPPNAASILVATGTRIGPQT